MEISGLILGIVALLPTLFPLLVQLDNAAKRKSAAGSNIPWLFWAIWTVSGALLGLYFLEMRKDLIALPVEWLLVCVLTFACWYQQLYYASGDSIPFAARLRYLLTDPVQRPFILTVAALSLVIGLGLGLFAVLEGNLRAIFLSVIGMSGALSFVSNLWLLPVGRDTTLNSPFGAFMPISLLIQAVGSFCSLIVYSLLYTKSDFVGISIFLVLIFGELGTVAVQSFLRKRAASTYESSSYAEVGQQGGVDVEEDDVELDEFQV